MFKIWALSMGLGCMLSTSVIYAKDIFQCNVNGRAVFQTKPCVEDRKTYQEAFNIPQNDVEAKKAAFEQAEKEYQERLKLSAAHRGDLVVVPKHTHIAVDKLRQGTRAMPFKECTTFIKDVQLSTPKSFKTSMMSDTKSEKVARICRADGSIVLACSEAQQKLAITESAHCPLK